MPNNSFSHGFRSVCPAEALGVRDQVQGDSLLQSTRRFQGEDLDSQGNNKPGRPEEQRSL